MKKLINILVSLLLLTPILQAAENDIKFQQENASGQFVGKLLPADKSTFQTELGISAFVKTLLPAADAEAFRVLIGAGVGDVTVDGDNTFTGTNLFSPAAGESFQVNDPVGGLVISSDVGVVSGFNGVLDLSSGFLGISNSSSRFDWLNEVLVNSSNIATVYFGTSELIGAWSASELTVNGNAYFDGTATFDLETYFNSDVSVNYVVMNDVVKLGQFTVASLPAGQLGMVAFVTDALSPTYNATVVGGGTVKIPVFYNGTNWVAH